MILISGNPFPQGFTKIWRRSIQSIWLIWLFLIISHFLSSPSWAVGNIHYGRIEINPGFQLKETYNDCIDVDDPNSRGDRITTFSYGLQLKWLIRENTLEGDYLIIRPRYAKHGDDWNYKESRLSTKGNFIFGSGGKQFTLDLGHLYTKSSDAPEIGEPRRKREQSQFNSKLKINFKDNMQLDFGYDFFDYQYEEGNDDHRENNYLMTMNVQIMPKTTTFVSARFGQIDYPNSINNSSYWGLIPGIKWDATAKVSGQVSVGLHWKDYEHDNNNARKDINTWIVMINLTHRLTDTTALTLGLDRGEREYSITKYDTATKTYIDYFNNYMLNKIQLNCNHQLTYKIRARLGFIYEFDDYQGIKRQDNIYQANFGLTYQIQEWLATEFELKQQGRDTKGGSDYHITDYTNNIVSLSLKLAL